MAERRAALRLSREQSGLALDVKKAAHVPESPMKQQISESSASTEAADDPEFIDELDDDPHTDDGHFYDDILEDV